MLGTYSRLFIIVASKMFCLPSVLFYISKRKRLYEVGITYCDVPTHCALGTFAHVSQHRIYSAQLRKYAIQKRQNRTIRIKESVLYTVPKKAICLVARDISPKGYFCTIRPQLYGNTVRRWHVTTERVVEG